jgi:pimeloyl-ACP methyl ester carboxylesterase
MSDIVLVHGAWHGGWCWRKTASLLRRWGHNVFTPTLTGLGERAHLLTPEIGLEMHVQDILNVLRYEDLDDVVLCGHSYAGFIVAEVMGQVPNVIRKAIFLGAFVPEPGQCLLDLIRPSSAQAFLEVARRDGDGWKVPHEGRSFDVVDPADLAWMMNRLSAQPLRTFTDRASANVQLGEPDKLMYIFCLRNHPTYVPFADRAKLHAWSYQEIRGGHDVMITNPDLLASILSSVGTNGFP